MKIYFLFIHPISRSKFTSLPLSGQNPLLGQDYDTHTCTCTFTFAHVYTHAYVNTQAHTEVTGTNLKSILNWTTSHFIVNNVEDDSPFLK